MQAIQLMRGLAAGVVAVWHLAFGFADHIGPGLGLERGAGLAAQAAVCIFFVISGYVMVISSRRLYGRRAAARTFLVRRATRILPSWWIASIALALVFLWLGRTIDPRHFALSFLLVPHSSEGLVGRPIFFLWPGWTLFYEMIFYLLFAAALSAGRAAALATAGAGIVALVALGTEVSDFGHPLLLCLTRPVFALFLIGMALAVFRERGNAFPTRLRWALAAAGIACWLLLQQPRDAAALGFDYLAWAGLPAICFSAAMFGGPMQLPGFRVIDRFGDISFAVYLLHVPLGHFWINTFPLRLGPWPFLVSAVLLLLAVSLCFFILVERPTTKRLNLLFGVAAPTDGKLERTGL